MSVENNVFSPRFLLSLDDLRRIVIGWGEGDRLEKRRIKSTGRQQTLIRPTNNEGTSSMNQHHFQTAYLDRGQVELSILIQRERDRFRADVRIGPVKQLKKEIFAQLFWRMKFQTPRLCELGREFVPA